MSSNEECKCDETDLRHCKHDLQKSRQDERNKMQFKIIEDLRKRSFVCPHCKEDLSVSQVEALVLKSSRKEKSKPEYIALKSLGVKAVKVLHDALGIKKLKCEYCGTKTEDVLKMGVMPSVKGNKSYNLVCGSPLCISEYMGDEERK